MVSPAGAGSSLRLAHRLVGRGHQSLLLSGASTTASQQHLQVPFQKPKPGRFQVKHYCAVAVRVHSPVSSLGTDTWHARFSGERHVRSPINSAGVYPHFEDKFLVQPPNPSREAGAEPLSMCRISGKRHSSTAMARGTGLNPTVSFQDCGVVHFYEHSSFLRPG